MSTNLAQQLREGTTKAHSMAENVSFVKSFLGGVVDKKSYRQLVANLFFVYVAIEEQIENNKHHESISYLYFPELNRRKSLIEDLKFYYGNTWKNEIKPSIATKNYVNRIHNIGNNQPELLIAHAYTRYMGDLSGGQILKKIAQNAMQLSENEGTAFYNFEDIQDENKFKMIYRDALNNVPLTDLQIQQIIAEANTAFNLNMKIFQELNSNLIKIMIMLLLSTINNLRKNYDNKYNSYMPKLKTRRSINKRFKITANKKTMMRKASRSHLLEKKSSKRKMKLRKTTIVSSSDTKNFKNSLPNLS